MVLHLAGTSCPSLPFTGYSALVKQPVVSCTWLHPPWAFAILSNCQPSLPISDSLKGWLKIPFLQEFLHILCSVTYCLEAGLPCTPEGFHTVSWHRQAGQGSASSRFWIPWPPALSKTLRNGRVQVPPPAPRPMSPCCSAVLLSHPLWGWCPFQTGLQVQAARWCFPAVLLFPSISQCFQHLSPQQRIFFFLILDTISIFPPTGSSPC